MTNIKYFTEGVPVEESAKQQLENVASLPFIFKHIAVMPDVHFGMGATIGSVIPTHGAIIPAAVGIDLGCGMVAVNTGIWAHHLPDNLFAIRCAIEKAVPHGRTDNGGANDRGSWNNLPNHIINKCNFLHPSLKVILDAYPELAKRWHFERAIRQAGTLGTGNHFIELCLSESNELWIMLHSGSRGIGNAIGTSFIELAKKDMQKWFINLPDKDLAYLSEGSEHFDFYVAAVNWAQNFAALNREIMLEAVIQVLADQLRQPIYIVDNAINCHHNYIAQEHHYGKNVWITRKGAVRARQGDLGIIPGSMGAKSFIVRGKGNKESFHSCSHGAGRVMSRNEARKTISLEQHIHDTEGVECKKDESVIDESPKAYKDIEAVMAAQKDLVEIVHTLKQILCVKG